SGEYHWMAGNFLKYGAAESSFGSRNPGDLPVDSHEMIALCAPRLTFISYGVPERGDARWLDHQGSYMAAVAAGPVFKLLGAHDLGVSNDYRTERMPPVNVGLLDGELAWRQHVGGQIHEPFAPGALGGLNPIAGGHLYKSLLLSINALCSSILWAQSPAAQSKPSVHWEELTAADFKDAIARAQGTCLLPFGILEKHGPHLPLGNDLLNVRYVALNAAQQEYAVVFPEYYFGQIFEAKHQPGTVAYSARLQHELLQETTDEMARNGCKKVIIVNGHGGNNSLLPYFAQSQLETPHDYVVYVLGIMRSAQGEPKHKTNPATDMHAGESETS